jgi:hypothetical protein
MAYPEINSKMPKKEFRKLLGALSNFTAYSPVLFFAAGAPMNIAIGAVMFGVMLAAANCT